MRGFAPRRAWAIAAKEWRHILRDPFTLGMALIMPALMVIFFGYAIDFDLKAIQSHWTDQDHSPASHELGRILQASGFIRLQTPASGESPMQALDQGRTKACFHVPPGFGTRLANGQPGSVQVDLDGADNQTATTLGSYLAGFQAAASARLGGQGPVRPLRSEPIITRFLFNPELSSRWFIVPAMMALVLAILCVLLTALTVAREWETGSMELLLSTPVQPLDIIVGKLLPYLGLSLGTVGVVFLLARTVFGIPFQGNLATFALALLLFLVPTLAQGLLISVVARQQLIAMQLAMLSGMLPNFLLSGFIFPVESMPAFFQWITMVLPGRWFVLITRDAFLRGSPIQDLLLPFGMLAFTGVLLLTLSLLRFNKDLEP
jgi:ABC-2 type transport system permease protein